MLKKECKVDHCSVDLSFDEKAELEATLHLCLCNMCYVSLNSESLETLTRGQSFYGGGDKIPASSTLPGCGMNEECTMCAVT